MTADETRLISIVRAALSGIERRSALCLAAVAGSRFRLPVPTAVVGAFLHRDLRRHLEHLLNLKRRAHAADGDAGAKEDADRLEALLKTIPEHSTRTLIFAAVLVMFVLSLAYFSPEQIGSLLKITVSILTLDFTDAYETSLKLGADGLWWRFPLFLALTYGAAHFVLLLAFWVKRDVLELAASSSVSLPGHPADDGATRFDRLAAKVQIEANGAALPPAAFDRLSYALVYLGTVACGMYLAWFAWQAQSWTVGFVAAVFLLIGLLQSGSALWTYARVRRAITAPP